MKIKTEIRLYKLAGSKMLKNSPVWGAAVAAVGGTAIATATGLVLPAVVIPGLAMMMAIAANDKFLNKGTEVEVHIGGDKINRENIKSLISSYFFLSIQDGKEINALQKLFLPNGSPNKEKIYQKFFLKKMPLREMYSRGVVLTKEEISEIEKTYPGLFKEVLGEFLDRGILEHILFKVAAGYLNKEKDKFITEAAREFYPEYKMDLKKINNFTNDQIKPGVDGERLKLFLPFIDRNNEDLMATIIENSEDDAIGLLKGEAQKLKSQEIVEGGENGSGKNNKIKSLLNRTAHREQINILLGKIGDEELLLKFENLIKNYSKVSEAIEAVDDSDIQNLEKTIWVNNVYKNIYPSINAYADLVTIGAGSDKNRETIDMARASINKQFDMLNEHLLEIGQTFEEETISDRLKRIKLQEMITAKTLTNR